MEGFVVVMVFVACGVAAFCCFLGYTIGEQKNQAGLGLICGLLLGPIGVLIVAVMPPGPARRGYSTRTQRGYRPTAFGGEPFERQSQPQRDGASAGPLDFLKDERHRPL